MSRLRLLVCLLVMYASPGFADEDGELMTKILFGLIEDCVGEDFYPLFIDEGGRKLMGLVTMLVHSAIEDEPEYMVDLFFATLVETCESLE